MAKGMKASVETLALSQVNRELDLSALQALRQTQAQTGEARFSLNAWIMAAAARTLPKHPYLNAQLLENEIAIYEPVNLGMAVATPLGLVVAVLQAADRLTLVELAARIEDLGERARAGRLGYKDIEGGTFTVSNLGMFGVDSGFPIPRPPESAILLVGATRPRPAAVGENIELRLTAWFCLTYDHRFIDGVTAALFLQDLQSVFDAPQSLLD
jgi:pyruvate/2-oxoglutarate dehydrogenase complex dihydrolipoamide acyltransferase (E2) component